MKIREEDLDQLAADLLPKLQVKDEYSLKILRSYLHTVWDYGVIQGIQQTIREIKDEGRTLHS